nr:MAG TPA: hypothetical protein [Caudoviricetes sp.]
MGKVRFMWIDARGVEKVLEISLTYAYKVIHTLQDEQEKQGYYVNPNCKVPIVFFCERFGLNVSDVKARIAES